MLNLWLPDVHIEKSKMSYLKITVFWCCGNFLDKRKLTYLIIQTLHVHFVKPTNWLGLLPSYSWIMQSLRLFIFLYQQMIALKKSRKMLFVYFIKSFFLFSRYSNFYVSVISSFSPAIASENDKSQSLRFNWLNKNLKAHFVWYLRRKVGLILF